MLARLFAFIAVLGFAASVEAAEITLRSKDGMDIVSVTGRIEIGDDRKFEQIAYPLKKAIVVLNSDGGYLAPGLGIGREIRRKGFATMVDTLVGTCASACGFAWLAGNPRMLDLGSKVGFHAAFTIGNGKAEINSAGNAIVGGYLRELGLNDMAIAYLTAARPETMQWLNATDAAAIGLEVEYRMIEPSRPRGRTKHFLDFSQYKIPFPEPAPRR